jgi:hypothetical protein
LNFEFDPGGFLLCNSKKFMFVVIAKNASTTLKRLIYSLDYPDAGPISDTEETHEYFGYSYDNKVRIPLTESSKYSSSRYLRFAIYRDPVERFLSVYYDKVSPLRSPGKPVRKYFAENGVINADIDKFLAFTERELQKENWLLQDEHLRCQSSFYEPSSVDFIVPLERLNSFLNEHLGIKGSRYFNKSSYSASTSLHVKQKEILEYLYRDDYELVKAMNIYQPALLR